MHFLYWLGTKLLQGELPKGCLSEDGCMGSTTSLDGEGKQVLVGVCAMAKKSQSKPMKEILTRLEEFEYLRIIVFPEEVILNVMFNFLFSLEARMSSTNCYVLFNNGISLVREFIKPLHTLLV